MEAIIVVGIIVFIIGLFSLAEYFASINSRALESAYASLSGVIAERDELRTANDSAQAEIRELESNLFDATTKPIRICEACAIYPCKCE